MNGTMDVPMEVCEEPQSDSNHCNGPNSEYVKLISSEGREFIVERKHALVSPTIKGLLNSSCSQNGTNTITFEEFPARVLFQICLFLKYKHRNMYAIGKLPEFPLDKEVAYETILAADYLGL